MNKSKTYYITVTSLIAALLCIFGPMSVPIGPIPVSLTNFVLYFSIYLLGTKFLSASYIIYLLLGLVGLPVFSGYMGGAGKLFGPTGGYLIGFIPMIIIMGMAMTISKNNIFVTFAGMVVGTLVAYAFGTAWFVYQSGSTVSQALALCVYPFVLLDLAKMVLGTIIALPIRAALKKSGMI